MAVRPVRVAARALAEVGTSRGSGPRCVTGPLRTLNCIGPAQQPNALRPWYVPATVENAVSWRWIEAISCHATPNVRAASRYSGRKPASAADGTCRDVVAAVVGLPAAPRPRPGDGTGQLGVAGQLEAGRRHRGRCRPSDAQRGARPRRWSGPRRRAARTAGRAPRRRRLPRRTPMTRVRPRRSDATRLRRAASRRPGTARRRRRTSLFPRTARRRRRTSLFARTASRRRRTSLFPRTARTRRRTSRFPGTTRWRRAETRLMNPTGTRTAGRVSDERRRRRHQTKPQSFDQLIKFDRAVKLWPWPTAGSASSTRRSRP